MLTVGGDNRFHQFSGNISGNDLKNGIQLDDIVKTGTGPWSLTSSIAFKGTYLVNAGTLIVNGTLANSSAEVLVSGTGVLGGSGITNRNIRIVSAGHLAPDLELTTEGLDLEHGSAFDTSFAPAFPFSLDDISCGGAVKLDTSALRCAPNKAASEQSQTARSSRVRAGRPNHNGADDVEEGDHRRI